MKVMNILIAEDDSDDRMLIEEAFIEAGLEMRLKFVEDGQQLMDYLSQGKSDIQFPDIILLDLNMPRKDGRVALKEIRDHEELREIPVIVFTTSKSPDDISYTTRLGIKSFITKPSSFFELVKIAKSILE